MATAAAHIQSDISSQGIGRPTAGAGVVTTQPHLTAGIAMPSAVRDGCLPAMKVDCLRLCSLSAAGVMPGI